MDRFDIRRVAEGLTAYAIERQHGFERRQDGIPSWMEQRRFWTDAILQGMAKLDGRQPDPALMERFDRELEQAQGCYFFTPATRQMQKDTIRELRRFVSALEDTGDDRRRQVDVVWKLLEDMSSHLPWASKDNDLGLACGEAESTLRRMTAKMPIRFTRILLGGDAGSHWASGYASGAVTDAGAVKRTAVYQEAVRDYPDVKSWPALCTVYVGQNLSSASRTADACDFDLEIMNRAGDRFLKEPGVRWASGSHQMIISVEQTVVIPEKPQTKDDWLEKASPLLRGERPLQSDDLAVYELYSTEDRRLTFCLDLLMEEKAVFGRQLSDERDGSYIVPYVVYDEDTGAVQDTMDIELRRPDGEEWFHCKLSSEVRAALKEKLDDFCMGLYKEHLPEMLTQRPDKSAPSQTGQTM